MLDTDMLWNAMKVFSTGKFLIDSNFVLLKLSAFVVGVVP